MKILLATAAPPSLRKGNRLTALRWARILRQLGHQVQLATEYEAQKCDLMVALHARRSAGSIARFRKNYPAAPLIVVLTGTDLYRDIALSLARLHATAEEPARVTADRLLKLAGRSAARVVGEDRWPVSMLRKWRYQRRFARGRKDRGL